MTDNSKIVLKTALRYVNDLGLSIIPVRADNKKPFIKWAEYQKSIATKEQITKWFTEYPNAMIGIVTGEISGIMVIDCDSEKAYQSIQESLPEIFQTWIAKSPRGYHIYFKYPEKGVSNATSIIDDVDVRGEGGYIIASPSINSKGEKYSWIIKPDEARLMAASADFLALYNIYNNNIYRGGVVSNASIRPQLTTVTTSDHNFYTEGRRDNDLFHLANCLVKGGCERDFALYSLEIIGKNITSPLPENEIKAKIESAFNRAESQDRNITEELKSWILTTSGHFLTTTVHNCLQVTTRREKKTVHMALARMCEGTDPILERIGTKAGMYRKIEKDLNEVNYLNAPTDEFSIMWPLEIETLCTIYPGNIIIVAGSKSSGKTGFLLNVVKLNMNRHDIVYLNSEMGDTEFRKRLELFEDVKLQDWKLKAYHRASNFADLITPEKKIFIVDFLEVTSDFWKVAQYIQEIHKKLKDGICIIGLQKSDYKETGRGGDFSKEKARLYIVLDYVKEDKTNLAKIVDAKAWRGDENPRGKVREYKLVKGNKFFSSSGWREPRD